MTASPDEGETNPGLCARCMHHAQVTNTRGSNFHLCKKSSTDPNYPKYPRLPVLVCEGFQSTANPGAFQQKK